MVVISCLAHAATRTRQAREDIEIGISSKPGVDAQNFNCCTNRCALIAYSAASSCRPKLPTMSSDMEATTPNFSRAIYNHFAGFVIGQ
jgi:hypothetical protein